MSEIHKKNLSKALKGRSSPNKGKTYEEIMGVEVAKKLKLEQSKKRIGRKHRKRKNNEN